MPRLKTCARRSPTVEDITPTVFTVDETIDLDTIRNSPPLRQEEEAAGEGEGQVEEVEEELLDYTYSESEGESSSRMQEVDIEKSPSDGANPAGNKETETPRETPRETSPPKNPDQERVIPKETVPQSPAGSQAGPSDVTQAKLYEDLRKHLEIQEENLRLRE